MQSRAILGPLLTMSCILAYIQPCVVQQTSYSTHGSCRGLV
nr:MAG TPA: hypothetical protein [Bacteriophage sp.]